MYKGASRYQLNRGNPVNGYKIDPMNAKEEARAFAKDFLFYEQYLLGLGGVAARILASNELSSEERKTVNQLKKLCAVDRQGFELLEMVKSSNESTCEKFLSSAVPMLREIASKAVEANLALHHICNFFQTTVVSLARAETHTFMLKLGNKVSPGADIKALKKMYLEYGLK
jgi:hypothetical protein